MPMPSARSRLTPPALPDNATDEQFEALAWEQLKTIYDPEIPINIVELGLVYECSIRRLPSATRTVNIVMTVTAPGCGMGEILLEEARQKISLIPTVAEVNVELVFDPPMEPGHDVGSSATRNRALLIHAAPR